MTKIVLKPGELPDFDLTSLPERVRCSMALAFAIAREKADEGEKAGVVLLDETENALLILAGFIRGKLPPEPLMVVPEGGAA